MKGPAIYISLAVVLSFTLGILSADESNFLKETRNTPVLYDYVLQRSETSEDRVNTIRAITLLRRCEREKGTGSFIPCIDRELKKIASTYGAGVGIEAISRITEDYPELLSVSHDLSHTVGINALANDYSRGTDSSTDDRSVDVTLIDRMGRALVDCGSWGVMGCMHGVIEGAIAMIPKEERTDVVRRACTENPLIQSNQVYANHCLHWAGHGMAIFTNQTLEESLAVCEGLSPDFRSEDVQLCISGIFHAGTFPRDETGAYHENIGRVFDPDDPYFPCRIVPERFRRQCFAGVAGRSGTRNLGTIFRNCHNIPEKDGEKKFQYVRSCYDAAANILSAQTEPQAMAIVTKCRDISQPVYRPYCYIGALRYWFLRNPTMANTGPSEICKIVEQEDRLLCATALGAVIWESSYSYETLEASCKAMVDPLYYNDCVTLRKF